MNGMKILFIIVILIAIYYLLAYLFQDKSNLSNSILSGQVMTTIPATNLGNSASLNPSNFTYSMWFNINDWNYLYGQNKVLFGRMGSPSSTVNATTGLSGKDPCPVVVFDAIENDIMILKRDIIDVLIDQGINQFILIGENVLNFHYSDDCYYEEWFDDVEEGWIAMVNFHDHVVREFERINIDHYFVMGGELEDIEWRTYKPQHFYEKVEALVTKRLG